MLEPGEQVDGRFVVEERVGAGGMAEVWRIRHVSLGSVHALKVLSYPHPGLRERFLREGQIQVQIRHPNVVAVSDVIEHRGLLGLLMEFVDHVSLQELVDRQGPVPIEQALPLFARILSGVQAAHSAGVLHRDLKPANILMARSPEGLVPKITDFGIAKVVREGIPVGATREGSMMGTPGYMAPEQALNARSVDQRADVFALGAILYTMLVGAPPFDLESEDIFQNVMDGNYPPLDQMVPSVPPHVAAAVHGALNPDPAARLPTARALAEALYPDQPELLALVVAPETPRLISVTGAPAGPITDSLAPVTYAETITPEGAPTTSRPPAARRSRAPAILATVGAGGLVLALIGLLVLRPEDTPAPNPEAPASSPPTPAEVAATPPMTAPPTSAPPPTTEPSLPAPEAAVATPSPAAAPATASPSAKARARAPEASQSAPTSSAPPAAEAPPESAPTSSASVEVAATPTLSAPAETVPEATPEPAPEVAPAVPSLRGAWSGTVGGRPADLKITSQSGAALKGELILTLGSTQVVVQLSGSLNPETGELRLAESGGDNLVLNGTLSGDALSGTYMREGMGRPQPWSVRR